MKLILILANLALSISLCAQDTVRLNYTNFISTLRISHPALQKAELERKNTKLGLMSAKGAFDPKLYSNQLFKDFKNINYYDIHSTQLSIPNYIGDFKVNYNSAFGQYTNPSEYTPSDGLIGMYYNLPLLNGMMTDVRRTELKKQSYSNDIADANFAKSSLSLALLASKYYWDWAYYYHCFKLSITNEQLALKRFQDIKLTLQLGEASAMDTIEAQTQWLIRFNEKIKLDFKLQQYQALLKNFLWNGSDSITNFIPQDLESSAKLANELIPFQNPIIANPDRNLYAVKVNLNKLDARLKKEQLKPKLDVYMGFLSTPNQINFDYNNRATGVVFEFPLFLRKERSSYKIAQNKIFQAELDLKEIDRKINQEFKANLKSLEGILAQATLYETLEKQYFALMNAEIEKFNQGESSVFMVNTREQKWVETRLKKIELITDFYYQLAVLKYIAGNLI